MKSIVSISLMFFSITVTEAQQAVPKVDASRVKMSPGVVNLAKPKDDLSSQISTTEPTEIYGYVSFTDPATSYKRLPSASNGEYSGYASVRVVFKSKKGQADWVKFGDHLNMNFAFNHVEQYLKYDLLVKPGTSATINPFFNSNTLSYSTTDWELYSFQLVWVFFGDGKSKFAWNPASFPDKIINEQNQDFSQTGVYWLPLNKLPGVDPTLPAME